MRRRLVPDEPARAAQKDTDARWTVKFPVAKPKPDGSGPAVDLAIPTFGHKNHVAIDRQHGLIRTWTVTDAARHDGAQLIGLIDKTNTAASVWADTSYRSKKNEAWLATNGLRSCLHRRKPQGRPMPRRTALANAARSRVRSAVKHVFARQKGPMGLVVRTIGIARPGNDEDRPRQSRLRPAASGLAQRESHARISKTPENAVPTIP